MREKLYRKEITLTIVFSILLLLMVHSASIFVLFPSLQSTSFSGFPAQYIVPIILGWFGIAVVCFVMTIVCNKFDDELEEFTQNNSTTE